MKCLTGLPTSLFAAAIAPAVLIACAIDAFSAEPKARCATAEVMLQSMSWAETQKFIDKHKGQVVLVDVWTTTCPVCREHFPEFVKLHRRLGGRRLACVSLNCDYDGVPGKPPEHYAPRVREFLKAQNAQCANILLSDPLIDFLDAARIGSTPTYLLYAAGGELRRQFDGSAEEFTFTEVAQAVESAISTRCATPSHADRN